MKESTQHTAKGNELLSFLNHSPTPYHAVENSANLLRESGFTELREQEAWRIKAGGKYFVTKNKSAFLAFTVGEKDLAEHGFRIIQTHTDSPGFKLKPGHCTVTGDGYVKLNTEVYGGPIISTWFDRPLAIAGKLILRSDGGVTERIVNLREPLFIIPNLAIHLMRDMEGQGARDGNRNYNRQTELFPLVGMKREEELSVESLFAERLAINKEDIVEYELFLYEYENGRLTGERGEFISASRIDDLAMLYCGLSALLSSADTKNSKILAAFDNEEVGSTSVSGARSAFFLHTLNRICKNRGLDDDAYFQALANSIAVSADTAHAVHPNYSDRHDIENRPLLCKGPVIKYSAAHRYATTAATGAYFIQACERAKAPYQKFVNRNDTVGGSTIGPASSSLTAIPTVDIGIPMLAMHSVREFCSVKDNEYVTAAFQACYEGAVLAP